MLPDTSIPSGPSPAGLTDIETPSPWVGLTQEFRLDDGEVMIKKVDNALILLRTRYAYADLKALFDEMGPPELDRSGANPQRTRSGISAEHGPPRHRHLYLPVQSEARFRIHTSRAWMGENAARSTCWWLAGTDPDTYDADHGRAMDMAVARYTELYGEAPEAESWGRHRLRLHPSLDLPVASAPLRGPYGARR